MGEMGSGVEGDLLSTVISSRGTFAFRDLVPYPGGGREAMVHI